MIRTINGLVLVVAMLLSLPAFALVRGVPTIQGVAAGTPVPVSQAEVSASGSLAAIGDTVPMTLTNSIGTCVAQIEGTWVGTIVFEVSANGTTFFGSSAMATGGSATALNSTTVNANYFIPCAGQVKVQVRASAWTSGTATVAFHGSNATSRIFLSSTGASQSSPGAVPNAWPMKVTDGTNVTAVNAAATPPTASDPAMVVAQSPIAAPVCTSSFNFNTTVNTQLAAPGLGQKIYICSIIAISATAQSISIVEGTGTNCATGLNGLIGASTASMPLAANGGFSAIAPRPWLVSKTAGDAVCLYQSGTGAVSGVITYVIQ